MPLHTKPALTARWANLVLLTFQAPEKLLQRYIHPSLQLDRWNGETHVSLVAFDFLDTRIFGVRIPGLTNFPEVNLRTYVRHGSQHGVSFIRELVPSRIIAAVARAWYNEPYRAVPMSTRAEGREGTLMVSRTWSVDGSTHRIVVTGGTLSTPPDSSIEHNFKEHEWGYGRSRRGGLLSYRVSHPQWQIRKLEALSWEVDFSRGYGRPWSFLNDAEPISRMFAVGSRVTIYRPSRTG